MSWWWPFKRERLLSPGVEVREVQIGPSWPVGRLEIGGGMAVIGSEPTGTVRVPVLTPVYIGSTIRKPRWWEVWRWHLYPRWRRESRAAWRRYLEVFGAPNDSAVAREIQDHLGTPTPTYIVRAKPTEPPPEPKP